MIIWDILLFAAYNYWRRCSVQEWPAFVSSRASVPQSTNQIQAVNHRTTKTLPLSLPLRVQHLGASSINLSPFSSLHPFPNVVEAGRREFYFSITSAQLKVPSDQIMAFQFQTRHVPRALPPPCCWPVGTEAPGACFSKAPKTFRACEAIFNRLYLKNKEVHWHETLHEGNLSSNYKYVKRTAL